MVGPRSRENDRAWARLSANVAGFGLGVSEAEILSIARGDVGAAFARQVAMYLCYTCAELSLSRVAAAFERDRTTVAHACRVIEERRDEPQFELWIGALETMLRDAPMPGFGRALVQVRR
jgi:hypothetical protein